MKQLLFLSLVVTVLAQDQTQSLGITATAVPTATAPITPPAQRPLAACSADPLWRRLRNPEGLDPCALAMNLQRTCTTIDPLPALTGGESYTGPTSVAGATPCICTTVMYNLVAACAACQHQLSTNVSRNWVPWSTWSAICPSRGNIVDGVWNRATLYNSTVPSWAFAKVFQADWFDLQQAVNTGVTSTSSAPSATASAPSSSSSVDPKIGVIVGAVLGGVGLVLLILTCIFGFLRRRQRRWEESEGVNQPHSPPYIIGKRGSSLHKPSAQYGPGGLVSPARERFDEKPRAVRTETALPDVLADEHRQGKPDYTFAGAGYGYGTQGAQGNYTPVPNPGVAGVGAGGRGLAAPQPVNRVSPREGPEGVADAAGANRYREGIFKEDFSNSEGHGYRSSAEAESRHFRNVGNGNGNGYGGGNGYGNGNGNGNGNGRGLHPPSSYPYPIESVPERGGGGQGATLAPERPDEDVHAYSTVGDASISVYPSSGDHHGEAPPPFVGGFTPPQEKEEYRMPDRGYSSGYAIPDSGGSGGNGRNGNGNGQGSPGLDADPFAANRRPTAFSRVFGERPSPTSATGPGRGSAGNSPTTARGNSPVINRAGGSPILTRGGAPSSSPVLARRGTGGNPAQEMGFGRQHQTVVGGFVHRDSNGGFSEDSSPTAVGFAGDVGSARGEGSPLPNGPFPGRSGFGAGR